MFIEKGQENTNLIKGYRILPKLNLLLPIILFLLFVVEHASASTDPHASERGLASSQRKWC